MSDILDLIIFAFKIYCYISILLLPIVLYYLYREHEYEISDEVYPKKEWYRFLKIWWARNAVKNYQNKFWNCIKNETVQCLEQPRKLTSFMRSDSQIIFGTDQKGNSIYLKLTLKEKRLSELCLQLRLADGTIYQLPEHPLILLCSIPDRKWTAKGLEINILEPFKTLKITYNGLLRNCIRYSELSITGQMDHIFFSFIWKAAAPCTYFPQDTSEHSLARSVAMEPWKDGKWINLLGSQTGFDQYGMLLGEIRINEGDKPIVMRLTSCRKRIWGEIEPKIMRRCLTLFACDTDGLCFNIEVKSYRKGCKQLLFGSVITPNKRIHTIEHCNISLRNFLEDRIVPGAFTFKFTAGGMKFKCSAFSHIQTISDIKNDHINGGYTYQIIKIHYIINKKEGKGFGIFWYEHKGKAITIPEFIIRPGKQILEPENKYIVPIQGIECRSTYLAGIKGTNLSLLTAIPNANYHIPDGFCILSTAFQKYLDENKQIGVELNNICQVTSDEQLKLNCERIKNLFQITQLSEELSEEILTNLQYLKVKHSNDENLYFWAVRSSSVEDIEKLPMIRNQTYLDCKTDEDVLKAVWMCWRDIYSYPKVQYRRKFGLPILCNMAVVIQPLIRAESSGVLTTIDTTTMNPSRMIITANYGLGVSIITESVSPDIITIDRSWDNYISIESSIIQSKFDKIIVSNNGIAKVENFQSDSKQLCLTEEQIYQVVEAGIEIEIALGQPQIIEFSFYKDLLYILSTKAVKPLEKFTNFDLIHENNTAIMSENDLSVRNLPENYFNTPCSTLTLSLCVTAFEESLENIENTLGGDGQRVLSINQNWVGTNISKTGFKNTERNTGEEFIIHQLITNGTKLNSIQLNEFKNSYKQSCGFKSTFQYYYNTLKYCWNMDENTLEATILSKAIRIKSNTDTTALQLFKIIKRNIHLLQKVTELHFSVVKTNLFYQKLLLNLLYDENTDLSENYYNEFLVQYFKNYNSKIIFKLDLIALILKTSGFQEVFCSLNGAEAIKWLEENCSDAMELFEEFMEQFGHRGINEFELLSEPWETKPLILIKIVQEILRKKQEIIDRSKKNNSKSSGKLLKYFESFVRKSFANKTKTLSAVVLIIHKFRLAFLDLSKKLVDEQKLPDTSLIFHLKMEEIDEIIREKNSELISKALQRKELYPGLKDIINPDVITKEIENNRILGKSLISGHISGTGIIVDKIQDGILIKQGNILVTKYFDIGFGPFLPLISGVVTENCSAEGASLLRYRNIPCISEAIRCTQIIQNGEQLMLLANTGVVEKI